MKKFVSLVLAVLMLASMLTAFAMPASAEEEVTKPENATWLVNKGDDHVWWQLDNGSLTVGGSGTMPNFLTLGLEDRPWANAVETITAVEITFGVTSIGERAFQNCTSLKSVSIPSSVTSIGMSAFNICTSLKNVSIPSGVTSIGQNAFWYCTSLESVSIPSSVTSIGMSAFSYCKSLQSITIPSGVTSIGESAFSNCKSLQSITIPSSVTSIGESAFSNCTSLSNVTISSGVTGIGKQAFMSCTNLSNVTIPSSVTEIDHGAFQRCTGLTGLTFKASTPPTLNSTVFLYSNPGFTIYVPYGMGDTYKSKSTWSNSEIAGKISEAYIVDDLPAKNGTVTLSRDCFPTSDYKSASSETVTVTATPDEGYRLKSLVLNYGTKDHDITKDKCFTMPCDNVTVKAEFETINCKPGTHSWDNGVCTACGMKCPHENLENDACAECGMKACLIGKAPHIWDKSTGKCSVCEYECPHENLENDACAECGMKACLIGKAPHTWDKSTGKCSACEYECQHSWSGGICTVCEYECPNDFHNGKCPDCGMGATVTGSTLSEGSLAIITAIAGIAVGMAVMFFIMKKQKPALAENSEE